MKNNSANMKSDNPKSSRTNQQGTKASGAQRTKSKFPKNKKNAHRRNDAMDRNYESDSDNGKFRQGKVNMAAYNDVSWYAKNERILLDAASFSYNSPLGTKIDYKSLFSPNENTVLSWTEPNEAIPGIFAYTVAMLPGVSVDNSSPINLAAQNIYSYVRYKNSGAKNYEAADLMLYLLAMDSAYAFFNFAKRAYGLIQTYSQQNWYIPNALFAAQSLDYSDFIQHIADFRMYLNVYAAKLTSFCVPATMSMFVRHSWLFSNVYKDQDNNKAQLYVSNPMFFYGYDETTAPAGRLGPIGWFYKGNDGNGLYTFADLMEKGNALLDRLFLSEDIGIMSGDILKAYGNENLFKVTPVDADYRVEPVYNEEVLNQIHNATIPGYGFSAFWTNDAYGQTWAVTQNPNTGAVLCNPHFPNAHIERKGVLLNMPWETVTPANTMVGSRFACCIDPVEGQTYSVLTAAGTDLIVQAFMFGYEFSTGPAKLERINFTSVPMFVREFTGQDWQDIYPSVLNFVNILSMSSNFDWCPLIYPVMGYGNGTTTTKTLYLEATGFHGDISKYTIISKDALARLHLTAVMSELDIPVLGSF